VLYGALHFTLVIIIINLHTHTKKNYNTEVFECDKSGDRKPFCLKTDLKNPDDLQKWLSAES